MMAYCIVMGPAIRLRWHFGRSIGLIGLRRLTPGGLAVWPCATPDLSRRLRVYGLWIDLFVGRRKCVAAEFVSQDSGPSEWTSRGWRCVNCLPAIFRRASRPARPAKDASLRHLLHSLGWFVVSRSTAERRKNPTCSQKAPPEAGLGSTIVGSMRPASETDTLGRNIKARRQNYPRLQIRKS